MNRFNDGLLSSYCKNNNTKIELSGMSITNEDLHEIINFLNAHPSIKKVDLSDNQLGDEGAKKFAQLNKTATTVYFNNNKIGDAGAKDFAQFNITATTVDLYRNKIGNTGAKALASNPILQDINVSGNSLDTEGEAPLSETNPTTRANFAAKVELPVKCPSLKRLSIYALKQKITQKNGGKIREIKKEDLGGIEDLLSIMNQTRF